ncbi:MAG: hydrolase [Candidatus Eisenbacteria bacterium]|nr:hydrolase [Candidatus Eisenbacteria bacterium]
MLSKERAVLLVVDVQGRLLPSIHDADATVSAITRLVRGFGIAGAPVVVTEQYRKGLGETDPRIQEAVREVSGGSFDPYEKMSFSCCRDETFRAAIEALRRSQVVLCGIESHVCVHQTALDLLGAGYEVQIAADAVSSRSPRNREIALQRLASEGAKLTTVETAVFEMLEVCGTDAFRAWSRLIR